MPIAAAVGGGPVLPRWKRPVDIIGSLAAIVLVLPIMGVLSLLVALDGGRPFFSQKRPGLGGRAFHCLKFRTMHVDAESVLAVYLAGNPEAADEYKRFAKLHDDPRITRLGRFLRDYSLDELPQLFNVLRGDMSLVGPRPRLMSQLEDEARFPASFGHYYRVRPGITGIWQVSGRSDIDCEGRYEMDRTYVERQSPALDLALILRTIPAVLAKNGAR